MRIVLQPCFGSLPAFAEVAKARVGFEILIWREISELVLSGLAADTAAPMERRAK